jgi:hypothetical protein
MTALIERKLPGQRRQTTSPEDGWAPRDMRLPRCGGLLRNRRAMPSIAIRQLARQEELSG